MFLCSPVRLPETLLWNVDFMQQKEQDACVLLHLGRYAQTYTHAHVYMYVLVLKWLPSKWNVPRRPWFYKEAGGGWERDKKSYEGRHRGGKSGEQSWLVFDRLELFTLVYTVGLVSVAV